MNSLIRSNAVRDNMSVDEGFYKFSTGGAGRSIIRRKSNLYPEYMSYPMRMTLPLS